MNDDRVEEVKKNILSPSQWVRILYMVFYGVACWVLLFVIPVIIICQVIIALLSGEDNKNLRELGAKLSMYFHSALDYLLYVNDDKPWPFEPAEDDAYSEAASASDDDREDEKKRSYEGPFASVADEQDDDDVFADISFTHTTAEVSTEADEQSVDFDPDKAAGETVMDEKSENDSAESESEHKPKEQN